MGIFKLKGWFGMWRVCGKQMHSLSFCLAGPPGIQVALTMFCYCVFLSVFSFYSQTPFSSLTLWLSWGLSFALGPWAGLELPVATGESKMRVLAWDLLPGVTWPQDTWLSSWREQGQVSEVSPRAGIICQFLDLAFFFFSYWSMVDLQSCVSFRCDSITCVYSSDYFPLYVITKY